MYNVQCPLYNVYTYMHILSGTKYSIIEEEYPVMPNDDDDDDDDRDKDFTLEEQVYYIVLCLLHLNDKGKIRVN